jgi:hypothetical protein
MRSQALGFSPSSALPISPFLANFRVADKHTQNRGILDGQEESKLGASFQGSFLLMIRDEDNSSRISDFQLYFCTKP